MPTVKACGLQSATSAIAPFDIERKEPAENDVVIDILFCGICHTDLHMARNDWSDSVYPMVPGHEIVGKASRVGSAVAKFAVGDTVAVGCLVGSCQKCRNCGKGLEQYCAEDATFTYQTYGGYSKSIVVDEKFVLRIPSNLDLAAAAPLLCAGITSYSPLRHWKIGPESRVGILGLGGLGHMGVKFAKAFGAFVVVLTTSPSKVEDAKRLGADDVVISTDAAQMAAYKSSLNFILDTAAAQHDLAPYFNLLDLDGTLCQVGAPSQPTPVTAFDLFPQRRTLAASGIGSIAETQQMLDFCAEHNIVCDIEKINMQDINTAFERLEKNDVKYRFVIDMSTL